MNTVLTVILGIHHHIPNGTDASTFERIYAGKIRPILSNLYKFPKIPAILHFSGPLWYWIERRHPEILMLTGDMVGKKQLELLSGGFYEPVMPLISYKDRLGHIEMLTTYLRKHFGKRTQGCLLPELAWDASMPSVLNSCNIAYTLLSESYFFDAGLNDEALFQPYISEDKGKLITIFPFSSQFAGELEENVKGTIDRFLSASRNNPNPVITIFPPCLNGQKSEDMTESAIFSFLSELSAYENEIDFTLPSKLIKSLSSLKKIYFPQKALKQFLIEYPETNYLYNKMVFVRALIDQLRGDKISKRRAYEELWKAHDYDLFCNARQTAKIRSAAYRALLEAESITRDYKNFIPSLMAFDFNFDGVNEYLFQGEYINCFINRTGANIFELDHIPSLWNYGSAAGVNGKRYSFCDMIAPPGFSPDSVINKNYSGVRLCGNECYEMTAMDRQRCRVSFRLPAYAGTADFSGIEIEKTFNFKKNEINVTYCLKNTSGGDNEFIFIPELNLAFPSDNDSKLRIYSYNEYKSFSEHSEKKSVSLLENSKGFEVSSAAAIDFQDIPNELIINLHSDNGFAAWIFSESVSENAAAKSDADYLSSRVLVRKHITLAASATYSIKFTLSFQH
ncbi:MAG: DUF1926 domain-containing protein [Treponema sp.]|jgi:hypothetical protein|nr:DUF1926 domain-containing protein [Treponema sp.]